LGAFPVFAPEGANTGNRAIRSNKNAFFGSGVWGKAPNSENKNAQAFLFRSYPLRCPETASMPFQGCKFFAMQKTYGTITAGLRGAHARLKPGCVYRTYQAFSPRRACAACF
jgi:hypothetical protein